MRLAFIQHKQRKVTSLAASIKNYAATTLYALYAALSDYLDTVGVCGSNPHAPTNPLNKLGRTTEFSVAPKRST